ncbi:MAG TPA: hypothetical protein VHT73_15305 [Thermodesulfobacteriota bacterium]|nr:hypothetical protein [Thermodesulfobacteriota bacterium]
MEKAIEEGINGNLPNENIAWAKVILGSLYFNKGDLKGAEKHYKEALGILHNKLNKFDEAKRYLDLALSTNPYFDMVSPQEARIVLKEVNGKIQTKSAAPVFFQKRRTQGIRQS